MHALSSVGLFAWARNGHLANSQQANSGVKPLIQANMQSLSWYEFVWFP